MKLFFGFFLVLMLSGCTAKKLALENADTLLSYQINKRLPLYSKEKKELDQDIDKFLNKSRSLVQEILPVIDALNLDEKNTVDDNYQKFEDFFLRLSKDFSKLLSRYIAGLDLKQRKEFFKTLDKENRELLKKEKKDRINDFEERFEMFFGDISKQQKQLIREYADYFQSRARDRLKRRVVLHKKLKDIFLTDISRESKELQNQEAFIDYQNTAREKSRSKEILFKLLPTLTKSQKEHFRKEVTEIKELLEYFISLNY